MKIFEQRRFNPGLASTLNGLLGFGTGSMAQGDYGNGWLGLITEAVGWGAIVPALTIPLWIIGSNYMRQHK